MKKILIVLKDEKESIQVNNFLQENGFISHILVDIAELINKVKKEKFDIVIIDNDILKEFELNIANFIKEELPYLKIIIVARDKINEVIELADKNNFYYLQAPLNFNELKFIIKKINEEILKQKKFDLEFFENKFIGKSEKILKIKNLIKKIAKNDSNVLITGETGTGKELIARSIYELSNRSNFPFITVNCAAIPENLLESELFGFKKGAFTGADKDKRGLIELADNGTLFLDEIGDLSLNLQAKLLRVIEYKEFMAIGDDKLKKVNVRIIAATNQDLPKLIKEKKFREDLFFRINVVNINVPPLRERKEDIPLLIRFFIEKYNKIYDKNIIGIDQRARIILLHYDYPGNVRELENIIQHCIIFSETEVIRVEDLPQNIQNTQLFERLEEHKENVTEEQNDLVNDKEFNLAEIEKNTILRAFAKYGNNHTKVAKVLGISRSTLWRKIREYGLMIK